MVEFIQRENCIIDIETVPHPNADKPVMPDDYIKYGNTKDESKREIIKAEHKKKWDEEIVKRMSLDPLYCMIVSIAVIVTDDKYNEIQREVFYNYGDNDTDVICNAISAMSGRCVVGHNVKGFDIPVMWKRSLMLGERFPLSDYLSLTKKYDTRSCIDTMQIWTNFTGYVKLKEMCRQLGIAAKQDCDGSKVYDMWKAGQHEDIAKYNMSDCEAVLQIMKRIS